MRKFILFAALICCVQAAGAQDTAQRHHNKIDDITSAGDILPIIKHIWGKDIHITINTQLQATDTGFQKLIQLLKPAPWVKADFDSNGYTDIMLTGRWGSDALVLCIMDEGDNHFAIKRITRRSFRFEILPLVKTIDNVPAIVYYYHPGQPLNDFHQMERQVMAADTLIYKFGDFVEYNRAPKNIDIEKIEYKTSRCFGTCPEFEITIDKDKKAEYKAISFNKDKNNNEIKGEFKTTIDTARYAEITGQLNYIDVANLKDKYRVNWTDDQTCYLTITYNNGQTKTIADYGLLGSFGLNNLYGLLSGLRLTQNWK